MAGRTGGLLDPHGTGRQAAVDDAVAVRIGQGLPHPADDLQTALQDEGVLTRLQPQVQALQALIPVQDDARAELVLADHVHRPHEAVMAEAAHHRVLVAGHTGGRAQAVGIRRREEADAGAVSGLLVLGAPILPALALVEGPCVVDDPGAGLPLAPLDQADAGQEGGEDHLLVGADLAAAGRLADEGGDALQAPGGAGELIQPVQVGAGVLRQ